MPRSKRGRDEQASTASASRASSGKRVKLAGAMAPAPSSTQAASAGASSGSAGGGSSSSNSSSISSSSSSIISKQALEAEKATAILAQYIGSLRNNLSLHNAVYDIGKDEDKGGWSAHVDLPFNSPVRRAHSYGAFSSKQLAKQSAAYSAVRLLMEAGEISASFTPTPANPSVKKAKGNAVAKSSGDGGLGDEDNAAMNGRPGASGAPTSAVHTGPSHPEEASQQAAGESRSSKKSSTSTGISGEDVYDFISSPRWWLKSHLGSQLYPTVITLSFYGEDVTSYWQQCRALVLLTGDRLPFPHDEPLVLDISQVNVRATATLTQFDALSFSRPRLETAFTYTSKFFRALLNKAVEGDLETTSYCVLPLQPKYPRDKPRSFGLDDIAWDEVNLADGPVTTPFNLSDSSLRTANLEDAVISSSAEMGRRFYVDDVRHDLSPCSPDPTNDGKSYLDVALTKEPWEYRGRLTSQLSWPKQRLVEVHQVVPPKSGGVVASLHDLNRGRKIVILEFLERYFIPASTLRAGTALISVLSALDDEIITYELGQQLSIDRVSLRDAITCPGYRPFPGSPDYERLEILGDTLLKLAVSVAAFLNKEGKTEGLMTYARHLVVSNKALKKSMIKSGVVPYIRGSSRRARDFVPPNWWIHSQENPLPRTHILGDKTVADVSEAIIGAAYLSGGRKMQAALKVMKKLCIDINLDSWDGLTAAQKNKSESGGRPLTLLGYTFRNPAIGRVAISLDHDQQRRAKFERLEFLGDAVIDLLTLEPLWLNNPKLGPAPLTHMKHSRVANSALGAFLVRSGLWQQLTDLDPTLQEMLPAYVKAIDTAASAAETRRATGKGKHKYEFWNAVPGHKWAGDIVEAVFGAIFEDSGFDLGVVARVFMAQVHPFVERHATPPAAHSLHPKSMLLELLATRRCHEWRIERSEAPAPAPRGHVAAAVILHGKVIGSAVGAKTALAVRNACEAALGTLADVQTCSCV